MEPTRPDGRIRQLDVLRGVALLGILVINVRWYSSPAFTNLNPSLAEASSADVWVWGLSTLLFEEKMIALFSMLFGAGIGLMATRGIARQLSRLVWLFGIGAAHAYGLWFGDILMVYAGCGVALVLLRRLPVALLLLGGTLCVLQPAYEKVEAQVHTTLTGEEPPPPSDFERRKRAAYFRLFAQEIPAHTSMTYAEQARWRAEVNRWWQFGETMNVFRCGGLMLIGLALFRLGFLTGAASARTYSVTAGVGLTLGLALTALGMQPQLDVALGRRASSDLDAVASAVRYVGAAVTAVGIAGLVLAVCRSKVLLRLATPLAAVGRMALTCYLAQTITCVLIYEGWAGGAWGAHTQVQQATVVGWIWLGQLALCPFWLAYFRFGPAEWLWRSLTYRRLQPMRVPSGA